MLVDPPRAMSTRKALRMAVGRQDLAGGLAFIQQPHDLSRRSCRARRRRSAKTAGMVPLPGSDMPRASVRQFIVLAVYMPEQLPQVGQADMFHAVEVLVAHLAGSMGADRLEQVAQADPLALVPCRAASGRR